MHVANDLLVEGDGLAFVPHPNDGAFDPKSVLATIHSVELGQVHEELRHPSPQSSFDRCLVVVLVVNNADIRQV